MSYYKAIVSGDIATVGNWNVWNGSTWIAASNTPTLTDDVFLNSYTMTTTGLSISYLSLRNTADISMSINAEGVLQFSAAGAQTFDIISELIQNTATLISFTGTLNGGITRTHNFIGNATLGNTSNHLITSNVSANAANLQVNHTGNITGNIASTNRFFTATGAGVANIGVDVTGNYIAGGAPLIICTGYATTTYTQKFKLTGTATASSLSNCFTLRTSTAKIDEVIGNLYPSGTFAALTGVHRIRFTDSFLYANGSQNAILMNNCDVFYVDGSFTWQMPDSLGGYTVLSNNANSLYSLESDTRYGVIYAGGTKTGTAHIPPPASVVLNVPVDDTVGTLVTATTPADFITALKADNLGVRLGKCATTEEVDSTVAAYNT